MAWSQSGSINIPGLVHNQALPDSLEHHPASRPRLLIIMVGLPARGKSYIAKKLARYLNWLQYSTRIFNVGERRRLARAPILSGKGESKIESTEGAGHHNASLFDPEHEAAREWRDQLAISALDELLDWFETPAAAVGIFDATNSTSRRRRALLECVKRRSLLSVDVLFLESICEDPDIVERNMRLKLSGPDYAAQTSEVALKDLEERMRHYSGAYVPVGAEVVANGIPFIRVFDTGRQITINRVESFLSMVALDYLLSFHLEERRIWLTCNGPSLDDVEGKIGRQSDLSQEGIRFSQALADFMRKQKEGQCRKQQGWAKEKKECTSTGEEAESKAKFDGGKIGVWTSMMAQSVQTAQGFPPSSVIKMKMLEDMGAGDMRGLTFAEISTKHPETIAARTRDVVNFRWPGIGGEGYVDVIDRLRTVVLELERSRRHVLVISHRAIVRVLLTYFMGLDKSQLAELKIPQGSLFSIEPVGPPLTPHGMSSLTDHQGAYSARVRMHRFLPQAGHFSAAVDFKV